ncbi:MAG: GIY-YIG nuclease family protein [Candidatus Berkiella sp.]
MIQTVSGTLYTGVAIDIKKRLQEHQSGIKGAKYLRGKGPLKLVYQQRLKDKSAALKREYEIKQFTKKEKEALIMNAGKTHAHIG